MFESEQAADERDPPIVLTSSGETKTPDSSGMAGVIDEDGWRPSKRQRVTRVSLSSFAAASSSFESECADTPKLRRLPLDY